MTLENSVMNAIDCIPNQIALLDIDGRAIYANQLWQEGVSKYAAEDLFVTVGEQWPGKAISDKKFVENVRLALIQARKHISTPTDVHTSFFHQGYQHHLTCSLSTCIQENTQVFVVSINIVMETITGVAQSFQLAEDEAIVFNALLEGVVIQDAQGVIISNNPASEKILGLTYAQMRGLDNADPYWGTITEDGQPCLPENHPSSIAILSGKPVYDFIMGVNSQSGEVRWLKINSQPIYARGAKKPYVSITSFVDITDEKRRQKTLTKLSERLQLALNAGQTGIWDFDAKSGLLTWDERMFSIFDIEPESFRGELSDFSKTIHPEDRQTILEKFAEAIDKKQSLVSDFRIIDRQNNIRHIYVAGEYIEGGDNIYFGINRDITLEKNAEQQLLVQRGELLDFIRSMPVSVFSVMDNSVIINKRVELLTGYSNDELDGVDDIFECLFSGDLQPNADFYDSVYQNTNLQVKSIMQIRRKDGELRWVAFEGCQLKDRQAWVMIDMTEQFEAENGLKKLAFFDSLTGLPNRNSIEKNLVQFIDDAKDQSDHLGLLVIDLDLFKNVNDTYGHVVGDQLLRQVAERLSQRVRACDVLGRIGGDEFMVVVRQLNNHDELIEIANRFIDVFTKPIILVDDLKISLNVTITIGASFFPEHGDNYVHLFKNADTALYHAKGEGKNRSQLYQHEFTATLKTQLELENDIEAAIENEAFSLYFQPIVDCASNQIQSAECLMRWIDPEAGFIAPDKFIGAAESTGQIVRLGKWVIQQAFKEFIRWQENGIELNYLSINLSPVQFNDGTLIEDIALALKETGIKPESIVFEITEGMLVKNQSFTTKILNQLKQLGIRLAIDDFGTGYSSLAYLKYFNVDILKIDRSFIIDIPENPVDMQIAGAILSMAKDLNLKVVAEGVETQAQFDFLRSHDCNTYQGYLKSPAISGNDFIELFNNDKRTDLPSAASL